MKKVNGAKKRMFYRLLNHLKTKQKKGVELPPNFLSIISKIEQKKIPD
jgi:hypothetical protein